MKACAFFTMATASSLVANSVVMPAVPDKTTSAAATWIAFMCHSSYKTMHLVQSVLDPAPDMPTLLSGKAFSVRAMSVFFLGNVGGRQAPRAGSSPLVQVLRVQW